MKYPGEVAERIKVLDTYGVWEGLNRFDILHLYPKELAYPNGYYDSRFFECVGFNTETMQKCDLGRHDSISFNDKECVVYMLRVFADGAYYIRFAGFVEVRIMGQELFMGVCR